VRSGVCCARNLNSVIMQKLSNIYTLMCNFDASAVDGGTQFTERNG